MSYLTAIASDAAKASGSKTLQGQHILQALVETGFGEWTDEVELKVKDAQLAKKKPRAEQDGGVIDVDDENALDAPMDLDE